jgi:uncharacterized membrane protein
VGVTEAEKEIKQISVKVDAIYHALGLDGSRPQDEIREKAKNEVRLWREKQALKDAKPSDQDKPCP